MENGKDEFLKTVAQALREESRLGRRGRNSADKRRSEAIVEHIRCSPWRHNEKRISKNLFSS